MTQTTVAAFRGALEEEVCRAYNRGWLHGILAGVFTMMAAMLLGVLLLRWMAA